MKHRLQGRPRSLALVQVAIAVFGLMLVIQGIRVGIGDGVASPPPPGGRHPTHSPEDPPCRMGAPESGSPDLAALASLRGSVYVPEEYRTRRTKEEIDYEVWEFDPREMEWLLANQWWILMQELETKPEPSGGLRILGVQPSSLAAGRGLRKGDVLIDINGKDLDDSFDVEDLLEDPAYQAAKGWRVRLLREDRVLTLDYRTE